jgi:dTDP-4-dehydrorhamnose 3,5-epimerase
VGHIDFVQDNESKSTRGVLRGLHYQLPPFAQSKLVRVISGAVLDVAVDIRRSSPTFGQHVAVELSADNRRQIFIPQGFAHGFLVLSSEAIFTYKVDSRYSQPHERGIRYSDPAIGIRWTMDERELLLSDKDRVAKLLCEAEIFTDY